ncbi:hypothetical protein LY90DRAFT_241571 [Neocallimastix californiae]|uniref:Rho GTPase activation protein n=1 Tax=Neocallimastix californiae TaxID=1754190 RepID=A0A1Y2DPM7_9FUNG|nr:hypothetical protein LY90DRAFT_241571 [Neocallimastix californiae]|eukprot:ORY61129.1 hypothetical protein LY90DRAFT_241571 [Neocallimastix californiae]
MDRSLEQKYTIHRSLDIRISEVKNVFSGEKQQNTYCTVHVNDNEIRRTPTVYNNTSPVFAEHFEFNPLEPNFSQLKIMVWSDVTEKNDKNLNNDKDIDALSRTLPTTICGDKALGQIIFPLGFLKSGAFQKEQWFVLQPTFENINKYNVSGDIRIEVSHTLNSNKTHRFEINIKQANDLLRDSNGSLPDPYVACYLLPDLEGKTAQITTVKKNSINPVFNSKIVYDVDKVTENLEINVSIWNWNKLSVNEFLGHCFVPLSDIPVNGSIDKRYTLLPKPARIFHSSKNKGKGTLKSKRRFTVVDGDTKISHRKFIQRLQRSDQKDNIPTTKRSHRLLDTKFYSLSFCGHCGGIIWVTKTHLKCGNCNFCCHQQCAKYVSDNCGGVVTLLLKITYNESFILPLEFYNSFLNVINENKYYLIELFGKLSSERENAALSLIKIQIKHDNFINCIKTLIEIEVSESESSQTLFRANSMVSKIIDVYMKYTGLNYLSAVLKDIIHNIVENDLYIEVDPSKLDDKKKINESLYNLTKYLENILNAIFSAEQAIPKDWRIIFSFIRNKVIEKYPTEYNVRFTSIAGFIFLRFFAPSILGPKLFGLVKTYVNERSTRTFKLLAKVIQTLANLSDFNEKELYMCPLNDYINAKLPSMKKYLNDVCNEDVECNYSEELTKPLSDKLIGYECSKLLKYYANIESKLVESITSGNVLLLKKYIDVSTNLMEYVNKLKKNEEMLYEENLKKKKVSEIKISTLTISSDKTYVNNGDENSIAEEEEDRSKKDVRSSAISLMNDENIKYISEYYKNDNFGEEDDSKFNKNLENRNTLYKSMNDVNLRNKANVDTIYHSTNDVNSRNNANVNTIYYSTDDVNSRNNANVNTIYYSTDDVNSRKKADVNTIYYSSYNVNTLKKKQEPSSAEIILSSEDSQIQAQVEAKSKAIEKKKLDRSRVLSMLSHIPQVGGVDFNYLNTANGGNGGKIVPPPKDSQNSPNHINNRETLVAPSSPFDTTTTSRRTSKSPFDAPSSPFDTTTTSKRTLKSPFDAPSSPFDTTATSKRISKSPFDSPASPFDARRISLSPYDDKRKASTNPSSPFDVTNKRTSVKLMSPFDSPRKSISSNTTTTTTSPIKSPFDISVNPNSANSPSSPFNESRRISTPNPISPFEKPTTNMRRSTISPFEMNKSTNKYNSPYSPIVDKESYNRKLSNVSENENSSVTSSRKTSIQYEDLIPMIPRHMSAQDCNEFDQAQGHIDPLNPLHVTQMNNPIDQEETIDIPESEINKEIYDKISKNLKYCCMCRMQILSEYITFDNERYYHSECFRCQRCDETLTSNNCYKKDNWYYCRNCYLFEEGYCCNECEEIIEGPAININGKLYHQDCFVCNACGMKLNKQYLAIDGRPYCKKDYLKFKGFLCGICGEFIEDEYITIFDRKYHINCKKCTLCGNTLNNKSFFSLPQDPYIVYCEEHKKELCTCHYCNLPIEDQMIRTIKKPTSYHTHCFKCLKCEKNLQNSDYFEKDENIYCRNCYIEQFL